MMFFSKTSLLRPAIFLTVFSALTLTPLNSVSVDIPDSERERLFRGIFSATPAQQTEMIPSLLAIAQDAAVSMADRHKAAFLVSGFGSPEQQTAVVPLHLAKALDPTYPLEERLTAGHRTIIDGTPQQRTAVVPFFLSRALDPNTLLEERVKAARSTTNYGTPVQKMQILMTAMSDAGLHQDFLHQYETPAILISAELQTYLLNQAANLWQNLPRIVIYAMIRESSQQPSQQWHTIGMQTMANYGPGDNGISLEEVFMD